MRHRYLVFAALLALFAAFSAYSQDYSQDIGDAFGGPKRSIDGSRKADPSTPQVFGQITDIAGRSVKSAVVSFIGLDTDEVVTVRSNVFGYYQTADLTPGKTYLISVEHRRYLFLLPSLEVTVGEQPIEFNFMGESAR